MPVLDVLVVGDPPAHLRESPASRLADAAGAALGAEPGSVWVTLRVIDAGDYAENGGGPPPGVQPVFVRVLRREVPTGKAFARQAAALTDAVANACDRPAAHVHVLYESPASGRLAFGGQPVE